MKDESSEARPVDPLALDYYGEPGVRDIARGIKELDMGAIDKAAALMATRVSQGDILVPIPGRGGMASETLVLAQAIAELAGVRVVDALTGNARQSMYEAKAAGYTLSVEDLGFKAAALPEGKQVLLVDNVIGTGATMLAAMQQIPNARPLVYAQDPTAPAVQAMPAQHQVRNLDVAHSPAIDDAKPLSSHRWGGPCEPPPWDTPLGLTP